jgi:NTE family protein
MASLATSSLSPPRAIAGVVFSGGGARGAYEAGVLSGILDVLNRAGRLEHSPFQVCCGTSVGAIHAAWLAAQSHRPDLAIKQLEDVWGELKLRQFLKVDPIGLVGPSILRARGRKAHAGDASSIGRAALDPTALNDLIRSRIPWARLRDNVDASRLRALIISALHVQSGRTTLFADLAPGVRFPGTKDVRRVVVPAQIGAKHVLASAALPMVFPTREIDGSYYCDGGVRFNTPIAPALRAGANRLLVIPLLAGELAKSSPTRERSPSLFFLLGKLLNALLLDPVNYDLSILERINRLVRTMENVLDAEQLRAVREVLSQTRGIPYRPVETLVFRPSKDIGSIARDFASQLTPRDGPGWLLARLDRLGSVWDTDLLSFVLFDGDFARALIRLGHHDVERRADDVISFFTAGAYAA